MNPANGLRVVMPRLASAAFLYLFYKTLKYKDHKPTKKPPFGGF